MKNILALLQKKPVSLFRILLAVVAIFAAINVSNAQNQVAKKTPKNGIWYYEYLPPDYNSNTNNYPIVFFLHGLGERGDTEATLVTVTKNGPPKHVKAGFKFPFILISPQLKSKYTGWPASYMDEVIEYCRNNLRVDQSRIYLTGLSLGGGGTWGYAQDPILNQKLAAIAPICGHQNNASKACNIVNSGIPVWGFHGDADGTVNYNKTVLMVKALNACVPAPNPLALITIYPGVGHNSWDNAYRTDNSLHTPNLYQWLLQFKNGGIKVNAGPDITLNLPTSSTNITGTASADSGPITTYSWTKVSGPAATITNPNSPTVSLTGLVAGVYTFKLTASNVVESSSDDVKITVAATNQVPVANAGSDISITLPTNAVNLNGSGSDTDGSITSYAWAKVSGPTGETLVGATTATLSLSNLVAGTYVYALTVKDNNVPAASATDNVTVVVKPAAVNQLPSANAGADKTVNLPTSTANLTGSGSDPDGTIVSYTWVKFSGPAATLTNATSTTVSLSGLVAGNYVFQLTVKDDKGASATDQVAVSVNAANQSPTANAGSGIVITLPTTTTNISGSGTDPEGSVLTYAWTQVDGPTTATLQNATSPTVTVKDLVNTSEVYIFRVTVTDDKGATGFADVTVTVNNAPVNVPPVANAGSDESITLPINSINLVGSGTDGDGTVTGYNWAKLSGPSATNPSDQNLASVTYTDLLAGTYVFRLTVTDNQTATHTDDITIVVQPEVVNQSPVADAGTNVVMTLPTNSATLTGSGTDIDGTVATYAWVNLSALPATISGQATSTLEISDLVPGIYTFQLTIKDDKGATDTDEVTVSVNAANVPPTANAGSDITITSPADATMINGTGNDTDGTIASYSWAQVTALPSTATLAGENTNTLSVSALVVGTYTFRLTVTDDDGDIGTDDVKVIVNAPANQSPTANAGSDKIITLPTNNANFTGSGIDPDGTIASYSWVQIGAPVAILTNNLSPTLSVEVPGDGIYTFRLTVTDNGGAEDFDDVILTVNTAANQAPTANAGTNQSITLPVNALTLTGSGSDPDGSITYLWSLVSGPTVTLTNETSPSVSLSDMIEGNYTFQLTVTDDGLLTATDQVSVTVLPAAVNQPPTSDAGVDQALTLPTNSITLFGVGSDPDGSVVTYLWSKISGPVTGTMGAVDQATLALSDLVQGIYIFRLEVKDNTGATATDDVTITVKALATNKTPVANAGPDQMVTLPTNILTLNGSGSDADGSITSYTWAKVSGPTVTLGVLNQPALQLSSLTEGVYKFRLRVKDNGTPALTSTDDVIVTVTAAATNQPPVVTVDNDKEIFQPVSAITIDGVASDADGSISSLLWIQVNGPVAATLVNSTSNSLTANGLLNEGDYIFRLTATDDKGATASDEIKVTVSAAGNLPPTVNAGADVSTVNTTVTLTAFGSDPDGSITNYHWEEVSGPASTFVDANPLVISGMSEGNYQFKVTVTDNATPAAQASDFVNVTILAPSTNLPPSVDGGSDVSIQLPENAVTLVGAVTDDGPPLTGSWAWISGPTTVPGSSSNTLALTGLSEGSYVFEFSADDGEFSQADEVNVTVLAAEPPILPPLVEIEGDSLLELPDNAVTLKANIIEANGLITYKWRQEFGIPLNILNDTTDVLEVTGLTLGHYIFRVTVTDNTGQESSDDLLINVTSGISNVFWPDHVGPDGSMGTWIIGGRSVNSDCEIDVYTKQGSKVYHSTGYSTAWDGTFNGKPLPEGVYFYVIRCSSEKAKTGSVTIIR
jgi:gliding motility-associated-like protein